MTRRAARRSGRTYLISLLLLTFPASVAPIPAEENNTLLYRSPSGTEFEVDAGGLAAIRVGGRVLAHGGWSFFNAEGWFKAGSGLVKTDKLKEQRFEKLDERHARVTHVKEDATCIFDYSFDGEDATISARVENHHPSAAMEVTGFSGLEFTFAKQPEGLMQEQHYTYFQAHGIRLCHPSGFSPIGGSYAQDGVQGVGFSPWRTGLRRTLILWDYTDWNAGKREKLPSRRPIYFVASAVPARGAQTFDFRMRVSPNVDWRHLMEPYREHFQATFGAVRYKADQRWIGTDYLNANQQAISPKNPYGFHGDFRRIDTDEGIEKFCAAALPALRDGNGQGIIVWGQGGEDPRGAMYRPDFDVLPPEVESRWSTLAQKCRDAGLKLGVCTRPCDIAVKLDWKQDQIIALNPNAPSHVDMIVRRFNNMRQRGCTLFYLDSFGDTLEDVQLMQALREKLGPDILTFCEHQCDAVLPFSGGYSEASLYADQSPPLYRLWSDLRHWEIYRWLVPGAQMSARLFEIKGKPAADVKAAERWMFENRVTPLVPVNDFSRAPKIMELEKEFLASPNSWSKAEP